MARQWTVQKAGKTEVDARHIQMTADQAIHDIVDALVELITNSDDAYSRANEPQGKIQIEVTRSRGEHQVIVKDRAGGMTPQELENKILRYGAFQAGAENRGFMGRGAKDIAALGMARFESIKNDVISCVEIDASFENRVMKPGKAQEADFREFGVKRGKGGTKVTLLVKYRPGRQHESLVRELGRHWALRDIVRRREVSVSDVNQGRQDHVVYTLPEGTELLNEVLTFGDPYSGAVARLKVWLARTPLPSESQEGVLVCGSNAIHQSTRFASDIQEDPIGQRMYGRLECDYFRQLQIEREEYRRTGLQPPQHNPIDIVDPNRRRGLDRDHHPFVKRLFEWAEKHLRDALKRIKAEEQDKERAIADEETESLLRKLSKEIAAHLKSKLEEEHVGPVGPDEEEGLLTDGVLLNPHFTKIMVGESRRMGYTVLSLGEEVDPSHVEVEVNGIGLEVKPKRPRLERQKSKNDRLTAYFEITGTEVCEEVELIVKHPAYEVVPPISRTIAVVPPADPYANLPFGLSFTRKKYTVHDNGTRTLDFAAKGRKYRGTEWSSGLSFESSSPEAVAILLGKTQLPKLASEDVWTGSISVRGRGLGRKAVVTMRLDVRGEPELASAPVEVSAQDEQIDPIKIKIVSEDGGSWRANWDRQKPNLLKVYARHRTLSRYLGPEEQRFPGQKTPHFKVLLAEIVAEKVVQRILEEQFRTNPTLFPEARTFYFRHNEEMAEFLPKAHRTMLSDSEARQMLP